jgi:hypothetical protein
MKIDLSKKQAGDKVFTAHDGCVEVVIVGEKTIHVNSSHYLFDGRHWRTDKHPTAFNSREEFDAYWAQVKE